MKLANARLALNGVRAFAGRKGVVPLRPLCRRGPRPRRLRCRYRRLTRCTPRDTVRSSFQAAPALRRRAAAASSAATSPHPHYPDNSKDIMEQELKYSARNYGPLPVVFARAHGVFVWDPEGTRYFDFLSAYSAVNQGHCHPKINEAIIEQLQRCALSSRAFFNDKFGPYAEYVTKYFGYDRVLPMNSGVEAVETALKMARKWGYERKGIPKYKGIILSVCGSFHGRTLGAIGMSCDAEATDGFGPSVPGMMKVPYNDLEALKIALEYSGKEIAAFLVEPIQGEAGVVVPDDGYLQRAAELCKKHNVLFIADEIQTGIARTGKMIACEWEDVRPDILILGKALSGGTYPVSAALADEEVMSVITPGTHGSTYGGNPIGCAAAMAALEVVREENLVEQSRVLGNRFRKHMDSFNSPLVKLVRGKGLLNAIVIDPESPVTATDVCLLLKHRGLLAKPTHSNIIRLAPPLVISESQLDECTEIIQSTLRDITSMSRSDIPGAEQYYGNH